MSGGADRDRPGSPAAPICPAPLSHGETIVLGHGSGGRLTNTLVAELFFPRLGNPLLLAGDDAGIVDGAGSTLAVTTDAHVVHPLFFPGGDIGRLAVCGTVNDLAVVGARPEWLAAAFILEEGFPTADLVRIVDSMREAADEAGVQVVAGDTKVAERGKVDGVYITTTGVGHVPEGRQARATNVRPGDAVILSGTLGDHGIAVLAARGDLAFHTDIRSDVTPLGAMLERVWEAGVDVHAMRDPTRGGLAATLNELAVSSDVAVVLEEDTIPVRPEVRAVCEVLGFDPLHVANEGKAVLFVPGDAADDVVRVLRADPCGRDAVCIGTVEASPARRVLMRTGIGGTRLVDVPAGELLPRIC